MPESKKAANMESNYVVKKGERIPRKPQGEYAEAESLNHAISRDGFLGTAMDDKNQYGPLTMMILLLIVATITGLGLKLLS
ncbi:MAG: hypothetical protein CMA05_03450 [Euryarchaeota archaeon]|jgi:hypothetical protein|nr:hypothetical protein [Euryarchaeota archaeon]|tara:strand:+ start:1139 stop:1381 length:243 start_codon:yes stop_codon:yes gene_type:complete